MSRDRKFLYTLSILFLILLFSVFFIPFNETKLLVTALLIIFTFFILRFIKKKSILSINKKQVVLLLFVFGLLFVMIYYLSGLHFGFYKSQLPLSFLSLSKVIIPIVISIILFELIRNRLLAQNNKIIDVIIFVASIVLEATLFSNITLIDTFSKFMDMVGLTIFPAITYNLLYNYLSRRYGFYPNIIFRLITTLFPYILAIVPATPDAIYALVKLVFPLAIYLFINSLYEKKKKIAKEKRSKLSYVGLGLSLIMMTSVMMVVSGQFRFSAIVIATGSMVGELNVGDVVIYEKFDDQIIKEGQIIVYKKNNVKVVHRVVKIQNINGTTRYYTKGDANDGLDYGFITNNDILGVTNFKISYIGYPSIWVNSIFEK